MTLSTSDGGAQDVRDDIALACPRDRAQLTRDRAQYLCPCGHRYPIIDGIPILLNPDLPAIHSGIERTLKAAEAGKAGPRYWAEAGDSNAIVDPVVQRIIGATNGILYQSLVGRLEEYPIPELRMPPVGRERLRLLDVGCNWGRWSLAAGFLGYRVVGIDPDLEAVLAAQRVATRLRVPATFIVGDARSLPFVGGTFDRAFSYSVLQHFAKTDAVTSLREVARVLKPDGESLIQMPNAYGLRSTYHRARRGGRAARNFEVRYWTQRELRSAFTDAIGPSAIEIDGFFGLGIQPSDARFLPWRHRLVIRASQAMRLAAKPLPALAHVADSLYVRSVRTHTSSCRLTRSSSPSTGRRA